MEDLGGIRTFGVLFFRIRLDQNVHPLGKITKTHGYNGTVVLVSNRTFRDDADCPEEVFVVIDGLPVPFPVEELVLLTDTSAHLKLEFVNNQNEALELMGCEVLAAVASHEPEPELETWTGYTVHDVRYGKIGVIEKIEDYKGNMVMQVIDGGRETLISLFPELITHIDHHAKSLHITAPDGYF